MENIENQEQKKAKEKTFIITPCKKNMMSCQAPSIAVWAKNYSSALIEAKKLSRLSEFENWIFI